MLDVMEYGEIGAGTYGTPANPCCILGLAAVLEEVFVSHLVASELGDERIADIKHCFDELGIGDTYDPVVYRNDCATPAQRLAVWELYLTKRGYTIEDIGNGRKRAVKC